jgi:hypothetical protein
MVLVVILVRVTKFKVVPDSLKGLMERRCWFGDQEVVGGWRRWGSDGEVGMTWPDNNTTNKTTRRVGRERDLLETEQREREKRTLPDDMAPESREEGREAKC